MEPLKKIKIKNKLSLLILLLMLILLFSLHWYRISFSDVTLEQLIFHIKVPLDGANMGFFEKYFSYLKSDLIIIAFIVAFMSFYFSKFFKHNYNLTLNIKFLRVNKKIQWNVKNDCNILFRVINILFCITLIYVFFSLDVHGYVYNELNPSTIFEKEYVDARNVKLDFPTKKQNLVYIFLESMESSYSNLEISEIEQNNLIPNLSKIAEENVNFSNTNKIGGAQYSVSTSWTIAGMVAQTSGVPLKLSIDGNTLGEYSAFLPGVYSLGEILEKEGYDNYLIMGSDKKFAGRSDYFEQHGKYDIFDYTSAIDEKKINDGYWVNWGYEDLKLFEYAKEKLSVLANKEKPFNFSLLTVDTHPTEGYCDNTCVNLNTNVYANSVMCSDKKVYDFVRWIQQQPFYDNTTIVISGDHLLMGNYLFPVNYTKNRTIYNAIINPNVEVKNTKNRIFTTMDMFPTTLASLGVKIDGERLGLGTNLFSNKKTLPEKMGLDKFNQEIAKKSNYYNNELLYEKK